MNPKDPRNDPFPKPFALLQTVKVRGIYVRVHRVYVTGMGYLWYDLMEWPSFYMIPGGASHDELLAEGNVP